MKVNKEKFIEVMNYLEELESVALADLDLSEFSNVTDDEVREWNLTGLCNRHFIEYKMDKRMVSTLLITEDEEPNEEVYSEKAGRMISKEDNRERG